MNSELDVVIVGAGLAGLVCAGQLSNHGLNCQLLEASARVGGRVSTDEVDGFLLDRGFQVFLTAYPTAQELLDYDKLQLCPFEPGALIRFGGKFHRLADPWRRPQHVLATALSPVATLPDKLRIAAFRRHTKRGELTQIYERPEQTTLDLLRARGFSEVIIERFFRPFLGGVFLDHELQTSSRMCEFVFRMFSLGDATLPAHGMNAIPQQLAGQLPPGILRLQAPVDAIEGRIVKLASGESLSPRAVVIASQAPVVRRLLGAHVPADGQPVTCLYFAARKAPLDEPILVLNGEGEGPINNLCVPSQVSPSYAPAGKSLISVTVLGEHVDQAALQRQVVAQLQAWFGSQVEQWQHLKTYPISYALPIQSPPMLEPVAKPAHVRDGVFVCGDHRDTASINGAMISGKRAAEAVAAFL